MSLNYKPNYCENCQKENSGLATGFQCGLLFILLCIFLLPGVIYYFVATPSRCRICGLKRRHRKEKK